MFGELTRAEPARAGIPDISVVYVTHRAEPRFDWFIESLAAQLDGQNIEVIFVDGLHSGGRARQVEAAVSGRFPFRHVVPKPSPYSGPFRLTQRDYWSASSARNTGVVYATRPYVVFVDDACVLMPGWLEEVSRAARAGYVVAGAYEKRWEMLVQDGLLVESREDRIGRDVRWPLGRDGEVVEIAGGQLFGCSCGIPRSLLIEVNGYDELCDVTGGEDYHLGVRIEWSGSPIYYSRAMLTIESEELHRQGVTPQRIDKLADEQTYMQRLCDFGVTQRSTEGDCDSSNFMLDILYGTRPLRSLGNYYELGELKESNLLDTVASFPRYHWFDHQPLSEM